jgi:hypothetical protein
MAAAAPSKPKLPTVDLNALRTNQTLIVTLSAIAFVLGVETGRWIVVFVGLSLLIGAASPGRGPFQIWYREFLKPRGFVKPKIVTEDPAPHRFAQAMGGVVTTIAGVLLLLGATTAGWVLVWLVVVLALANLSVGFCAGCFIFLQLRRAGLLGGARS